ncbi:MAG TPA: hypothetical protein VND68_07795 [Chloroflexia bacterium]|nr:hypothetical protein [Chloroflexia bacterium]
MLFNLYRPARVLRFAAIVTLLVSLALAFQGGSKPVQAQGQALRIGPIVAMDLDNTGSGWAWAGPASPTEDPKLLRIAGGTYRAVTINDPDAGQLVRNTAALDDIVLQSQIGEGWAIGTGGGVRIWRLQGGVWKNYPHKLGRDVVLNDLTVSNDGTDGWITGTGSNLSGVLLRLRNGEWMEHTQTPGSELRYVDISPNGARAWAVGQMGGRGSDSAAYQWVNGAWVARNTFQGRPAAIPQRVAVNGLTVDDNGNGWLLSPPPPQGSRDTYITRLTDDGPEQVAVDLPLTESEGREIVSVYLQEAQVNAVGTGWLTGAAQVRAQNGGTETRPVLLRLVGSKFQEISTARLGIKPSKVEPIDLRLSPVAITPDGSHTWLASGEDRTFLSLFELNEPWFQALPPSAPTLPGPGYCFQESRYCLRGAFARYWEANGGLQQFGFPITPEVTERLGDKTYTVQYTERARLEYHPEHKPPHDVLLGLLGNVLADPRLGEDPFKPVPANNSPGFRYFPQTGHNLGPPFLALWESRGGMPVFGLPRSEAFDEKSAIDGKTYTVQYFERNRLEYHPENAGTEFELLLGLLGLEQFQKNYGYKP